MELAEILAKLDLDGYQLVDHDYGEFQEGIPPTKWVSLLATIYTYQFNLLFVGTKALKQHAPAVLVYLRSECFCVEEY